MSSRHLATSKTNDPDLYDLEEKDFNHRIFSDRFINNFSSVQKQFKPVKQDPIGVPVFKPLLGGIEIILKTAYEPLKALIKSKINNNIDNLASYLLMEKAVLDETKAAANRYYEPGHKDYATRKYGYLEKLFENRVGRSVLHGNWDDGRVVIRVVKSAQSGEMETVFDSADYPISKQKKTKKQKKKEDTTSLMLDYSPGIMERVLKAKFSDIDETGTLNLNLTFSFEGRYYVVLFAKVDLGLSPGTEVADDRHFTFDFSWSVGVEAGLGFDELLKLSAKYKYTRSELDLTGRYLSVDHFVAYWEKWCHDFKESVHLYEDKIPYFNTNDPDLNKKRLALLETDFLYFKKSQHELGGNVDVGKSSGSRGGSITSYQYERRHYNLKANDAESAELVALKPKKDKNGNLQIGTLKVNYRSTKSLNIKGVELGRDITRYTIENDPNGDNNGEYLLFANKVKLDKIAALIFMIIDQLPNLYGSVGDNMLSEFADGMRTLQSKIINTILYGVSAIIPESKDKSTFHRIIALEESATSISEGIAGMIIGINFNKNYDELINSLKPKNGKFKANFKQLKKALKKAEKNWDLNYSLEFHTQYVTRGDRYYLQYIRPVTGMGIELSAGGGKHKGGAGAMAVGSTRQRGEHIGKQTLSYISTFFNGIFHADYETNIERSEDNDSWKEFKELHSTELETLRNNFATEMKANKDKILQELELGQSSSCSIWEFPVKTWSDPRLPTRLSGYQTRLKAFLKVVFEEGKLSENDFNLFILWPLQAVNYKNQYGYFEKDHKESD